MKETMEALLMLGAAWLGFCIVAGAIVVVITIWEKIFGKS
jgi:hypothetical protein